MRGSPLTAIADACMRRPAWLLGTFVAVQIMDALLTYSGVTILGLHAEANPIVEWYMARLGCAPGLAAIKLVAVGCGAILYAASAYRLLMGLAAFHVIGPVLAWQVMLH